MRQSKNSSGTLSQGRLQDLLHGWRKRLRRIEEEQLLPLVLSRRVFQQAVEAWTPYAGSSHGGELAEWMLQCYMAFAGTAIRRIAEPPPKRPRNHQRTLSLVILLDDMATHNKLLSRKWYVTMYRKRMDLVQLGLPDRDFERLSGTTEANHIPRRRIQADMTAIAHATKPIKRAVDKFIAHTEEDRRRIGRPLWQHVDVAIDTLSEIYSRYFMLLHAADRDPAQVARLIDVSADLKRVWPSQLRA